MKKEIFKKVYIKSEADLPKENISYFVHIKQLPNNENGNDICFWDGNTEDWINTFDWYLLPIEQEPVNESVVPTDKEIERMAKEILSNVYTPITKREVLKLLIELGQWLRSQVKTIGLRDIEIYDKMKACITAIAEWNEDYSSSNIRFQAKKLLKDLNSKP